MLFPQTPSVVHLHHLSFLFPPSPSGIVFVAPFLFSVTVHALVRVCSVKLQLSSLVAFEMRCWFVVLASTERKVLFFIYKPFLGIYFILIGSAFLCLMMLILAWTMLTTFFITLLINMLHCGRSELKVE